MRKVTWRRFDQSAKQLVVGQTTTATTVLGPTYRTICVSLHLRYELEDFVGSKILLPACMSLLTATIAHSHYEDPRVLSPNGITCTAFLSWLFNVEVSMFICKSVSGISRINVVCPELSMGPFGVTRSNPTHQLTDATQPTTSGPNPTQPNTNCHSITLSLYYSWSVSATCQIGHKIKFNCSVQPNLI